MATTPQNLQHSASLAVTEAALAIVRAHHAFPHVIDLAKKYGLDDQQVRELCADAGLPWVAVRELLDEEAAA